MALRRAATASQAPGAVGDTGTPPRRQRLDDGLGHRLLGDVEVAEAAVQRGDDAGRLGAYGPGEGLVGGGRGGRLAAPRPGTSLWSTVGRSSTVTPGVFSPGQVRATDTAVSWSGTSRTVNPPMTSLASEKGPSTISGSAPSAACRVVAVSGGCSSAPPLAMWPAAYCCSNHP